MNIEGLKRDLIHVYRGPRRSEGDYYMCTPTGCLSLLIKSFLDDIHREEKNFIIFFSTFILFLPNNMNEYNQFSSSIDMFKNSLYWYKKIIDKNPLERLLTKMSERKDF